MIGTISANICTLSPELLPNLKSKEIHPDHNAYKSDSFGLGMTILNAMLLKGNEECYNWQTFIFNKNALKNKLD